MYNGKNIYIRFIDLPRNDLDFLGYRGIRRTLSSDEPDKLMDIVLESVKLSLDENSSFSARIGFLIPLVSDLDWGEKPFILSGSSVLSTNV